MTQYAVALNEDVNGVKTSAEWNGSQWIMPTDGTTAIGDPADAAVTDPTASGTMVALLKGLLSSMKAEDVAALAGDMGIVGLAIRRDTATSDVGAAGDYTALHVDAFGRLRVTGTQLEDAAHTSGDAGFMALAVRKDTAAVSSGATGDYEPLQTDSLGRLRTAPDSRIGTLLNARTTALAERQLVKASAGTLFGFQGYTADDGFIQVHADADGTLSGGAQALEVIPVIDPTGGGAGAPFSMDFGRYGLAVATGITIAFSSTGPTYTAGGAQMFVSAQYE